MPRIHFVPNILTGTQVKPTYCPFPSTVFFLNRLLFLLLSYILGYIQGLMMFYTAFPSSLPIRCLFATTSSLISIVYAYNFLLLLSVLLTNREPYRDSRYPNGDIKETQDGLKKSGEEKNMRKRENLV